MNTENLAFKVSAQPSIEHACHLSLMCQTDFNIQSLKKLDILCTLFESHIIAIISIVAFLLCVTYYLGFL